MTSPEASGGGGPAPTDGGRLVLRLYVAGSSPRSLRAVANLREFVNEVLRGSAEFEVIDIFQDPEAAKAAQVVASPTLVKESPIPMQRILGDLSDRRKLAAVLAIDLEEE